MHLAPSTPEMQKLREHIAVPANFVVMEKHQIREFIDLWCALLDFKVALEQSQVLRGREKLTREWSHVSHFLTRLG